MQSQLWRCDNCGWGTFEPYHVRRNQGAQLRDCEGVTKDICFECVMYLGTAPRYELAPQVTEPTRKVK